MGEKTADHTATSKKKPPPPPVTMSFAPLLTESAVAPTAAISPFAPLAQLRELEASRTPEQKKAWKLARDKAPDVNHADEARAARKAATSLVQRCYRELNTDAILSEARLRGTKRPQLLYEQVTHIGATHILLGGDYEGNGQVKVACIPRQLALTITDPQHPLVGALVYFSSAAEHERGRHSHAHVLAFRVTLHTDKDYTDDKTGEPTQSSCVVQ
jgi:hypothetical protein